MRSFLREYSPAPASDPAVTKSVIALTRRFADGKMRRTDFTADFWKQLAPKQDDIRSDLKAFGPLLSAIFVGRSESQSGPGHRYKLEFKNAWVLEEFVFDSKGKLSSLRSLGIEWKHPLPP
jgi:hypothetical protein